MEMDYTAWIYRMMLFEQSLEFLTEEERRIAIHNQAIQHANEMAHSGSMTNDINSHLKLYGGDHVSSAMNWYSHGGETNSTKYIRKIVSSYSGETTCRKNLIDGNEIHQKLITPDAIHFIKTTHENTQRGLIKAGLHPADIIRIYRGLSGKHDPKTYIPNSAESWTTSREEATRAAHMYGTDHTILQADIKPDGILWSHLARDENKFIPTESELRIKNEHTVLGHKLMNIGEA